jgi:predicted nucleic acid-binding protein
MQLVVDTSVLVAELLRVRGRFLLTRPSLELVVTPNIMSETAYEVRRRLRVMVTLGTLLDDEASLALVEAEAIRADAIGVVAEDHYAERIVEARRRMLHDPDDVSTVALALVLDCGIWTSDRDFFGCGLPVWSTDVLRRHLEFAPQ